MVHGQKARMHVNNVQMSAEEGRWEEAGSQGRREGNHTHALRAGVSSDRQVGPGAAAVASGWMRPGPFPKFMDSLEIVHSCVATAFL